MGMGGVGEVDLLSILYPQTHETSDLTPASLIYPQASEKECAFCTLFSMTPNWAAEEEMSLYPPITPPQTIPLLL